MRNRLEAILTAIAVLLTVYVVMKVLNFAGLIEPIIQGIMGS
jgi:hypothetical protein